MASLLWGYGCRCLASILVSISQNKDETLSYSTIWISTDIRHAYKGLFYPRGEGSDFIDPYLSKVVYVYVLALSCICVFILSSSNFGRGPPPLRPAYQACFCMIITRCFLHVQDCLYTIHCIPPLIQGA